MTVLSALDSAGRRRSPATMAGYHAGRPPRNKGCATRPTHRGRNGWGAPAAARVRVTCCAMAGRPQSREWQPASNRQCGG
jgi:hypothetical protein